MFSKNFKRIALVSMLMANIAVLNFSPASAAAPMAKISAPAFYRVMLGDFEVTALSDGTVDLPMDKLLKNAPAGKIEQTLAQSFLKSSLETSVNAYLINTGDKLVLIDTGAGKLFGPTLGKLMLNLKASGYQPEQVDDIYITHFHADHVGGLMADNQLAFPNATVHADQRDVDFWLSAANMEKAPADRKGSFQGAMGSVNPYIKANQFKAFNGDTDLMPGIKARASYGHTAGHSAYLIESKGQKLMLVGDIIHVGAVQFEHPQVTIAFDSDAKAALQERKKTFDEAAKNGYLIGAAHLPFPGLGHVRTNGKAYQWVPVNHTQMRE